MMHTLPIIERTRMKLPLTRFVIPDGGEDEVTRIMLRRASSPSDDQLPTRVRLLELPPTDPTTLAYWSARFRLLVAAATSMLVAALLSWLIASCALEHFAQRENALRLLAAVAAILIITCAATSGVLAAALLQRLHS